MIQKMSVVSSCLEKKIGMWLYDSLLHKKYLLIKYYFYSYCNNHLTLFTIFDLLLQLKMLHSKLLHTILLLLLLQNSLASEPNTYWSWCANELQLHGKICWTLQQKKRCMTIWINHLALWVKNQGKHDKICSGTKNFRKQNLLSISWKITNGFRARNLKVCYGFKNTSATGVCCHMEEFQEVWLGT